MIPHLTRSGSRFMTSSHSIPTKEPTWRPKSLKQNPLPLRTLLISSLILTTTIFLLGARIQLNTVHRLKSEFKYGQREYYHRYKQYKSHRKKKKEIIKVAHAVIVNETEGLCDGIMGLGVGMGKEEKIKNSKWNESKKEENDEPEDEMEIEIEVEKVMFIPEDWGDRYGITFSHPSDEITQQHEGLLKSSNQQHPDDATARRLLSLAQLEYNITILPFPTTKLTPSFLFLFNLTMYQKILYTPPVTLPLGNPQNLLQTLLNRLIFPSFTLAITSGTSNFLLLTPDPSISQNLQTHKYKSIQTLSTYVDADNVVILPRKTTVLSTRDLYSSPPEERKKTWNFFIQYADEEMRKPWYIQENYVVDKIQEKIGKRGGDLEMWKGYYELYADRRKEVCLLDLMAYKEKVETLKWIQM